MKQAILDRYPGQFPPGEEGKLVQHSAFWKRNDSRVSHVIHLLFVTTEPEQRNINPKKYSSTSSFSTRFAKLLHGFVVWPWSG
jgi:hypothetical protein